MAQAAGLLGATPLAAYTILHNVETTVFMVALGLSVATAVHVGQAAGAGDRAGARFAGLAGLSAAMALVALIGLAMLAAAPVVVGFYSSDAGLIARAAPLIAILAVSMVFDAGQVVLGQATRALGDSWVTTGCFFLAFWGVMIPASLWLAFRTPLAEAGLFIGTGLGCATAVLLLGARFRRLVGEGLMARRGRSSRASSPSCRRRALLGIARLLPYRARLAFGSPDRAAADRAGAGHAAAGRAEPRADLSRTCRRPSATASARRGGDTVRTHHDRGHDPAGVPGAGRLDRPDGAGLAGAARRRGRRGAARCSSPATSANGRRCAPR